MTNAEQIEILNQHQVILEAITGESPELARARDLLAEITPDPVQRTERTGPKETD